MATYEKAEHYERTKPYRPMRNLYQNARPLFQPKVNGGGATYAKTEYR